MRTFKDGKLKISGDGLLLHDQDGIPVSGDVRNGWAGISTLQALFVQEHNAICDMLKVKLTPLYVVGLAIKTQLVIGLVFETSKLPVPKISRIVRKLVRTRYQKQ